jgi:hypothetical protein
VSVDSPLKREGWQIARSNRAAVLDGRCGTTGGRIATSPFASTHGYHADCLTKLRSSVICADCSTTNGSGGGEPALLDSLLTRIMLLLFVSRLRPR